ncbi:MAG: hypothetical protein D8M58_06045 [Calditrichaeota bacterium]|nr:MAG: hypothetical protein DWQ03_20460 [Calditrichota bacterium]MBL1204940.1 hypothetical protein [Calditrichota bacterium]NOG44769.1 histidine kinase [Calditrichota bacterium]
MVSIKNLIIVCILMINISNAQQYSFEHLSLEEGISYNLTYSVLQDSKGFMWFGTFYGLVRFDGRDYTHYKHTPYDSNSVSSDDIISLYEDKNGFIWVGTWSGGLNRFDPNQEKFTQYKYTISDTLSISDNLVYDISEDRLGRLWIATNNGLNRLVPASDPANNEKRDYFIRYLHDPANKHSINNNHVRVLSKDSKGRLWVGVNEGGLHYYDLENDYFIRLEEVTRDGSTSLIDIFEDDNKNLWLATWGGGLKKAQPIESDDGRVIGLRMNIFKNDPDDPYSISNNNIWSLEQDNSGNLWIGTYDGLNKFNPDEKTFDRYYHDEKNTNTLSSNKVSAITLDHSGVLWIGTFYGGIDRIVPGLAQFETFLHNPFDPRSLIDKEVNSLLEDRDSNVWVGTRNGITKIEKTDDKLHYKNIRFETKPEKTKANEITSFAEDFIGNIWVGTYDGLNCIYRNGHIERYNLPLLRFESEQGNIVTSLLIDNRGWLWVGTITHGLNLFDLNSKVYNSFKFDANDSSSISSNYVVSINEDREGNIWVGTYRGLNKLVLLSPSSGQPQVSFQRKFITTEGTLEITDKVFTVYEDLENNCWIGTNGGLISYDKITKKLTTYSESDGLPNDVICGILEDKDANLWMSTHRGIFKYNPQEKSFNNYYTLHGLQSNIFNPGSYFKNEQGKMMFGGINGFNSFFPENITRAAQIPPVVITSIKIFDKEKKYDKRINDLEEIELNYEENFFTIKFAALDYRLPERNQYYYFLEGFDRDWVYNETKNYASYTNLDPGEYVFKVRGSNSNGVWNEEGRSIRITITPPLWQTWWFKLMASIIVMIALLFVIYMIHRSEKRKTSFNKKLSELKLQALRSQMNPHFIFNTINSIQYFISCNDQESAFTYLSKFSKLMRQTLDNSAKSRISISRELEALQLYMDLQMLRFEKRFDYTIDVDPNIDIHYSEIPTMLIQPYIENAINHGISKKKSKGHIKVVLEKLNSSLRCVVEDDGVGINKSKEQKKGKKQGHTSSGMRLTRERLTIINTGKNNDSFISVVDRSEQEPDCSGTRVTINIPMEMQN